MILNRDGRPYDPHDSLIYPPRVPSRAWLRAASAHLLNANYATQPDEPGMVQPFPATAAACTALGYVAPTFLLMCDEGAGNLIDEIGGVACVPAGAPLQGRVLNGVAYGSNLWSKAAVELPTYNSTMRFLANNNAACSPGTGDFTIALAYRNLTQVLGAFSMAFVGHRAGGVGWSLNDRGSGQLAMYLQDATGGTLYNGPVETFDGAFHILTVSIDRDGNISFYYDAAATINIAAGRPGTLDAVGVFFAIGCEVGSTNNMQYQPAWFYYAPSAQARTGHDAMWRHLLASGLGFPNTYTRATPMVLPISATQTATAGSGQVGIGYCAAAVDAAGGNALGTGLTFENATSFLGVLSNNLPGCALGGATLIAVDGVNAMRSGIRVTMTANWNLPGGIQGAVTNPFVTIAAPSNTDYTYGGWVKRGTAGTSGRMGFALSTGGVVEYINVWASAAVPAVWTYITGTFVAANAGNTRGYLCLGAALNTENCEFSDWFVCKGTTVVPLAYIYTGTGAAVAMNAPMSLIDNTLGQRFSPAGGEIEIELAGFAGAYSVAVPADVFHAVPAAGDAGRLYWRYLSAGTIEITAYNAAGAVAWSMTTAAVPDSAYHKYRLRWCAANPVYRTGGVSYYACLEEITAANPEGAVIDYAGAAAYAVPLATTVPNLYTGSYAGINAARCSIASLDIKTRAEYRL